MLYENAAVGLAPGRHPFLSMPLLPTPLQEIFNRLSKYILRSLVQLESLRHSLNQSHHSLQLIARIFRACDRSRVFTLSSNWLHVKLIFILIGRCGYVVLSQQHPVKCALLHRAFSEAFVKSSSTQIC